MRPLEQYNPIVIAICFAACGGIAMFALHPVLTAISLAGALSFFFVRNGASHVRSHLIYLLLFAIMALINPLFNHRGATILFLINHNPVTLEAMIYGVVAAAMLISVLYWFRIFSEIMTGDKLLYLFGSASPKLALILSMALRYIPLFTKQAKKINEAQRAMGLYREENLIDNTRGASRVFSVMVTWGLENGIVTADSMAARGYGVGRRTQYSQYRFCRADCWLLALIAVLTVIVIIGAALGATQAHWYPTVRMPRFDILACLTYAAYALLCMLPTALEIGDRIRWNYLRSKI